MKNYKKATLAAMVVAAMPLMAAINTPIVVNTFADEDGENSNACSLREALKTAELRKSYGGCAVADTLPTTRKQIQLEAGTYTLEKELTPNVDVSIFGKIPEDWQKKSVIRNDYPAQTPYQTILVASNGNRIFNTTLGNKSLFLSNMVLKGGRTTDRGGAIFAGADISLQNTQILDAQAAKEGGAIYLAGPSASLTISNSLIQNSQAPKASVVAMSCFNDNVYSRREINIDSSSIIGNGTTASSSMLEFCGEPKVSLTTNTIAKNIVNVSTGNLIKFTGDTLAGTATNNTSSILSNSSSLVLTSNTITENKAGTTLLYDKVGSKTLTYNFIAYNEGGLACRYLLGAASALEDTRIALAFNALALSGVNKCDLPKEALPEKHTNIDVSAINDVRSLLSPLQAATEYTAFLPLYYPKNNHTNTDLVDTGVIGCSSTDQRGIERITDGTLYFDPTARNTCDIGSVELMKLTAGDLIDLSNTSISGLIASYQKEYDFFDNLVKNPNDPEFLTYYKVRLQEYADLLAKTKANYKYRAIYVNLKNYQLPLPQEVVQTDGTHKLQFFSKDLYTVTTQALGVGQIIDSVNNVLPDPNLVCEWNNDLEQIIIYRKDDVITQAGDKLFCKYTIQSKADANIKSSGLLQAAFVNVPPEAKNTSVTLKYQQNQTVSLDLLKLSNDFGDTGEGGKGPDKEPNKPQFWKNADGIELPIRLSNVPTKNLVVTADRQGACPEPDQKETCYGGNIYIKESNTFNPFNYSFNYQVYDADGAISNTATVSVISTATTTDDTRNASSGGGSMGGLSLLGLLGLLAYRRIKK
ncbi:CSLREA domain-containing protein [Acinetobacter junii]|uniref:CSLREA domain-containing protein n=1 Tax=Acinetobacter junii TaxID=40215 RepID=UPI0038629191